MKKRYLIPMLLPAMPLLANAGLPDEINYAPYESTYNTVSDEVDAISQSITASEDTLQINIDNENRILSQIETYQMQMDQSEENIRILQNELVDLRNYVEQLEVNKRNLKKRSKRLQSEINRRQGRINQEFKKVEPFLKALEQANMALKEVKKDIRENGQKIAELMTEVKSVKEAIAKEQKGLNTVKNFKKSAVERLAHIDVDITEAETKVSNTQKSIEAMDVVIAELTAKTDAMHAEVVKLNKKLQGMPQRSPERREMARKIQGILAEKKKVHADIKNQEKQKTVLVKLKGTQAKDVANLKKAKAQLPAAITKFQEQIKTKKANIDSMTLSLAEKESKMATLESEKQSLAKKFNKADRDQLVAQRDYDNASPKLARMEQNQEQDIRENDQIQIDLRKIKDEEQFSTRRYNETSTNLAVQTAEMNSASASIALANRELSQISPIITQLETSLANLRNQEAAKTQEKDDAYDAYISRYNMYQDKLADASQTGESQADSAYNIGADDAQAYAEDQASKIGTPLGYDLANAQANLWAAVRSEISGYQDGYSEGYASESDQEQGTIAGTQAGKRAANDHAQQVLKPQFFKDMFMAKISGSKTVMQKAAMTEEMTQAMTYAQVTSQKYNLSGPAPVSSEEMYESNNTQTNLDGNIATYKSNLNYTQKSVDSSSHATSSYSSPSIVPYGSVNCYGVYKQVDAFIQACKASYQASFKSKYLSEHKVVYKSVYENLFPEVVEAARASKIEAKYEDNMDTFYPIAKDSGVAAGKAATYQDSYAKAKANAYQAQLPQATSVAQSQAHNEVTEYIANNATLTVKSAEVSNQEVMAGDIISVVLEIKNISPKDLVKPAKIVLTGAKNVELMQKTYTIKKAPGSSTSVFQEIQVKVLDSALSGSEVAVSGKVILDGGKYEAQRVEEFTASTNASLNPTINSSIKYDSTPDIESGIWRWRKTVIHPVNITVSPEYETLADGYTISMAGYGEHADKVTVTEASKTTKALKYGESQKVTLKYKLSTKADGKKVQIKVNYAYQGKVLKSQILELKPH